MVPWTSGDDGSVVVAEWVTIVIDWTAVVAEVTEGSCAAGYLDSISAVTVG